MADLTAIWESLMVWLIEGRGFACVEIRPERRGGKPTMHQSRITIWESEWAARRSVYDLARMRADWYPHAQQWWIDDARLWAELYPDLCWPEPK